MPCGPLVRFREIGTHSRARGSCHMSTLRVETWQFYWYQSHQFSKTSVSFLESSGYRLYLCPCLVHFKLNTCLLRRQMNISPWEGRGQHKGRLWWRRRSPQHDILLHHKKMPRFNPNLKFCRCHFWELTLNAKLNIMMWSIASELLFVEIIWWQKVSMLCMVSIKDMRYVIRNIFSLWTKWDL